MANIIHEGEGKGLVNILALKLGWFQNAVLPKGHDSQPKRISIAKARTVWSAKSVMKVCGYYHRLKWILQNLYC